MEVYTNVEEAVEVVALLEQNIKRIDLAINCLRKSMADTESVISLDILATSRHKFLKELEVLLAMETVVPCTDTKKNIRYKKTGLNNAEVTFNEGCYLQSYKFYK